MEVIEWSRLIASLLFVLYLSAMSKLLSASSKPISTPSGLSFNPLENPSKSLKIIAYPLIVQNSVRPNNKHVEFYP